MGSGGFLSPLIDLMVVSRSPASLFWPAGGLGNCEI
jgi:hypothetical protein